MFGNHTEPSVLLAEKLALLMIWLWGLMVEFGSEVKHVFTKLGLAHQYDLTGTICRTLYHYHYSTVLNNAAKLIC